MVADVLRAAEHAVHHLSALTELLQLELREYARLQTKRIIAVAMGAVLLLCASLLLCLYAVLELQPLLGLRWSLLAVVGGNVVLGLVALLVGAHYKPAGVAPDTMQEIRNDVRCVQLYLKRKENS